MLLLSASSVPAWAQDVIYFVNGDRLTGKIKTLGRGQLVIDVPTIDGDAHLDWRKIARIDSARVFQFHTTRGDSFSGRIVKDFDPGSDIDEVHIVTPQGDRLVRGDDIVSASQTVGTEGVRQWQANIGAGMSLAKSHNQKQFNIDGSANYQTTNYRMTASVSSIFATQEEATNTNRQDLNFAFQRRLTRNWLFGNITGFQHSQEQQLERRIMVGGGPVRSIVNTNRMTLFATGGAIWNHERYQADSTQENPLVNQVEGFGGVSFSLFRFRVMSLDSTFRVFPSISVAGRVRGDFNSSMRIRLVRGRNLWWNLGTGLLFDSAPPTNGKATDYSATTSLSFSFP